MVIKIGIIGAPQSGKDEIANFFVKNNGFKKLSFAGEIKKKFFQNYEFSIEDFEESKCTDKKLELKIRNDLWKYSDEMRKKYGNSYFITPIIDQVMVHDNVVITDVRTIEEVEALEKVNVEIIVVIRNETPKDIISGTRIPIEKVSGYRVFWNNFNDLSTLHINLEKFYNILKKGENMDLDDVPLEHNI